MIHPRENSRLQPLAELDAFPSVGGLPDGLDFGVAHQESTKALPSVEGQDGRRG